jgi:hypothetical protein
MKTQARNLQCGQILTHTQEKVIDVYRTINTPKGNVNVMLEKGLTKRYATWNAETEIEIEE